MWGHWQQERMTYISWIDVYICRKQAGRWSPTCALSLFRRTSTAHYCRKQHESETLAPHVKVACEPLYHGMSSIGEIVNSRFTLFDELRLYFLRRSGCVISRDDIILWGIVIVTSKGGLRHFPRKRAWLNATGMCSASQVE